MILDIVGVGRRGNGAMYPTNLLPQRFLDPGGGGGGGGSNVSDVEISNAYDVTVNVVVCCQT